MPQRDGTDPPPDAQPAMSQPEADALHDQLRCMESTADRLKRRLDELDAEGEEEDEDERCSGRPHQVASIDEDACTLCGACHSLCPTEAITMGATAFRVNAEVCCGCAACVDVCPSEAIKMV